MRYIISILTIIILSITFIQSSFSGEFSEGFDYSRAVIHHTASPDVSAKTIDKWHKERGWQGIGYHFVIRKDGTVETGRELGQKGAHAKGRNNCMGIALTGYDTFTPAQINALKCIIHQYGITHIERHHENCPGKGLDDKIFIP